MSIDFSKMEWNECRVHVQSKLGDHDRELRDVKKDHSELKKEVQDNRVSVARISVYVSLAVMIGMAIFQSFLKFGGRFG